MVDKPDNYAKPVQKDNVAEAFQYFEGILDKGISIILSRTPPKGSVVPNEGSICVYMTSKPIEELITMIKED